MAAKAGGELGPRPRGQVWRQLDEVAVGVRGQAGEPVDGAGAVHPDAGAIPAARRPQARQDRGDVMAVHFGGVPAERLPFGRYRLQGRDRVDRAVDLGVVGVEQDGQPGEPVVGGEHGRLPDLALFQLAVADHGERGTLDAAQAIGEGEADGGRQALPQGAADVVHDRGALGADGLDGRAVAAVALRLVLGEQADLGRRGEDPDHVVARGAHEAVAAWRHGREERRHLLGRRQGLAEVAKPVGGDHLYRAQPDRGGEPRRVGHGPGRLRIRHPAKWHSHIVSSLVGRGQAEGRPRGRAARAAGTSLSPCRGWGGWCRCSGWTGTGPRRGSCPGRPRRTRAWRRCPGPRTS